MSIDFGKLNMDQGLNRILDKLDEAQKKMQDAGQETAEALGYGWDDGLDDSIQKINASSVKLESAIKNLTRKIKKQMQQLAGSVDGKNTKINIDFSDIDINETKFQQRVKDLFGELSNAVEFDTKGSEKQFENLIQLYVKYESKLQSLKNNFRNITDTKGRANNLKEQLVLAQNMQDIFNIFDRSGVGVAYNPFSSMNYEIKQITERLNVLDGTIDKTTGGASGDFKQLASALEEIAKLIREIKDGFAPLTTALNTEGNAFSAMAKEGSASLDTLLGKLKELGSLMDIISKKDFNVVNNISNKAGSIDEIEQIKNLRSAAKEGYRQVESLYNGILSTRGKIQRTPWGLSEFFKLQEMMSDFDLADLKKRSSGRSAVPLGVLIDDLNYWKEILLKFNELQNQVEPGSFDSSRYKSFDVKKQLASEQDMSSMPKMEEVEADARGALTEIRIANEQIEGDLKTLREQIEATFDLSTIDMKRDAFSAILDGIYRQFVELQAKIKALDFGVDIPDNVKFIGANQMVAQSGEGTESSVIAAADAISKEGEAAAEAAVLKDRFAEANKAAAQSADKTASSVQKAAEGIEEEGDIAKATAVSVQKAADKLEVSQEEIIKKYKEVYGGRDKVKDTLAAQFNKILKDANVDASSITASFAEKTETVGKGADKQIISYDTIKLVAQYTDELGKANTITREYEVATGALIKQAGSFKEVKDVFDLSTVKSTASSQFAELEKRMGSFKVDISEVKKALSNITDESSFKVFQNELDAANQKIKEIKASLKSSKSLDPIVNSESMMSNLKTTVDTYRENIKKFADIEGFDKLESSLGIITEKLATFNDAKSRGDGKEMASIVADINAEITKYNANLKLVNARYQENTRVAQEAAKAEKQRIKDESAAARESTQQKSLELDLDQQLSLLVKQQAQWEKNGQLTDEVRGKINAMVDSLVQVTDSTGLKDWKKQWAVVKNEVAATKYEIEATKKAQKEMAAVQKKENEDKAYWDRAFRNSLDNLIIPEQRPELEEIKSSMLRNAAIEQYDAIMTIISQKNNALQKMMSAKGPAELQYWKDEYSAWFGAWRDVSSGNYVSQFFEDAANSAMLGEDRVSKFNKELERSKMLAARKEDADNKLIQQEIADAEKKAAQVKKEEEAERKRIAIEKALAQKQSDQKKQEELNVLYTQRKQILSELLDYTKQLNKATDEASKKAAQQAIDSAAARLAAKNAEIFEYGDLVDLAKLNSQDEVLTEGLRKFNWGNYIKEQANESKAAYENVMRVQKEFYEASMELEKVKGEGLEPSRLLEKAAQLEKEYNDAKTNTKLTQEQKTALAKEELRYQERLISIQNKNKDKENEDAQKAQFKEISDLYSKYLNERASYHKMSIAPNAKDLVPQLNASNDIIDNLRSKLLSLGVDLNNIDQSSVLTQEQKNELLKKEAEHRERIIKQYAEMQAAENKAATKEQERIDKQNKNYGKSRFNTETRNYDKIMASYRAMDDEFGVNADFQKKIDEYEDAYRNLERLRKQFAEDPTAASNSKLTEEFQDAALKAERLRKGIQDIIKESNKLDDIPDFIGKAEIAPLEDTKDAMKRLANEVSGGTFEFKGFNDAGTEMYGIMKAGSGAIEEITIALKAGTNQLFAYTKGTKEAASGLKKFMSGATGKITQIAGMYLSFHDIIRYLRSGVETVREIDLAMTELRKVTDETEQTYAKFLDTASKSAGDIGSTVVDFTTVTSDFARLGYSIEEASELAKTALVYENVGDGFNSVDEASESVISTMKAFGIEAEDAMGIVDRFNAVGNNFAITSKGIGDALQRSASALVEGGNTIDEAIGLVTAANSVIQNPEQVGTALKTLSLRLRGAKVELEEAGEDVDGMAESTAQLQEKLLALTGGKVDIMLDENTFKNTTQILREMSTVWEDMTDINQAAALELLGGKRQAKEKLPEHTEMCVSEYI